MSLDQDDIRRARFYANFYKSRGFQPLPSRPDAKRPMVCYSDLWEQRAAPDLFERFETSNIQVMTGRYWRLLVIDADGPAAVEKFESMGPPLPPTWVSWSGGNGRHYWFMIPQSYPRKIPYAVLWKGDGEHEQLERLCDHKLVMAPPSIHPVTGARYAWKTRRQSPYKLSQPAQAPDWLIAHPGIATKSETIPMPAKRASVVVVAGGRERYRSSDVLDAIHDKVDLAVSWGVRFATRRSNSSGWCSCHAIGRPDKSPSASFSEVTGRYWEAGMETIDLFTLAVELGVYSSREDAVVDLARRFHARAIA